MAKLVGIAGLTAGREFALGELSIIGRSPNAQVRLPDLAISRQHAKVTRQGNAFIIEDLGSTSGTLVNEHYITVSHLRPGDEITIGDFAFRFEDGPVDRLSTAEFKVVVSESQTRIVSVDAARFTRPQPLKRSHTADDDVIAKLERRLNAILVVGQVASRSPDASELLDRVMEHCLQVFDADRGLVAVPDRERQNLMVVAMALREGVEGARFSLSHSVISDVLYKGRSVITSATRAEGRSAATPRAGAERPRSPRADRDAGVMVAPLICHGQMLGLVYVDQQLERGEERESYREEDLEVLTGMAAHMALALHSAQLREGLLRQSRTEQELAAAHEVQKRFLPQGVPKLPDFSFIAHYDPCRDVGGDLYDFIPLDEGRLGVVIGDVSGKGFGAAIVMAWVASQLRVAAHQEQDPSDVLARVNESLIEAHQDDLFVTLIYGVLNRVTMTFRFCNAGHVPPLVRRLSGRIDVVEQNTGLPVGVVQETSFEERRIGFEQGDVLLLVTDGVTEAMNPKRRMFGLSGLASAMSQSMPTATSMVADVLGALRDFVAGETQYDDITIVAAGASPDDLTSTLPPGILRSDYVKS
jgi:serine phosphatase RsbU (regulator of sigma subunit)